RVSPFSLRLRAMAVRNYPIPGVMSQIRRWAIVAGERDAGDGILLRRFLETDDEHALTSLMHRHGAMVFGVCLRILRDVDEAEDVFQATFLVLLRRAGAIRRRESLAGWLHGVAYRLAQRARADAVRRRQRESRAPARVHEDPFAASDLADLRLVLDEELSR